MVLSTRQKTALGLLLARDCGEITLGELGASIGVSGRTIARELARIAPSLQESFGLTLAGKAGQGLRIVGEPEQIQACMAELEKEKAWELDSEARLRLLALFLIEAEDVVKLHSLETDLHLSLQAVRHDLQELRGWLEANGLSLTLRRGVGVLLSGGEEQRRQALSSLILEEFGEAGLLELLKSGVSGEEPRIENPLREEILGVVPAALFKDAEAALAEIPKREMLSLAPRDYLGLVIHLAVGAARKDEGHQLSSPGEVSEDNIDARDPAILMAFLALSGMAGKTGLDFGPPETLSFLRYLRGAKPERPGAAFLGEIDLLALTELKEFIQVCGELYGSSFAEDSLLRDGLAAHWGPALYRIRNGLPIQNPLLDHIRSSYARLFLAIRGAAEKVFPALHLPDDEIAFLAMHFGSSLERREASGGRFRALVVCSAGIGSARMLASRIKTELPEIDIVASLSWFDVSELAREACDLLVSTIPLPIPPEDYVLVNPLLPPEGVTQIRQALRSRRKELADSSQPSESNRGDGSFDNMKIMQERLSAAIELLERFRVFSLQSQTQQEEKLQAATWNELLTAVIRRCETAGLVADATRAAQDLIQRSADGGIMLPGSALLFLHARSSGIDRASVTLHELDSLSPALEAQWPGWSRRPSWLVLMLAPKELGSGLHDILNEISSSFLEARTEEVLESGNEEFVRSYYTRLLDRFARAGTSQGVY